MILRVVGANNASREFLVRKEILKFNSCETFPLFSEKERKKKPYFPTKSSIFVLFFLLIGKFFLPLFLIAIQNLMNDYSSVYDWFSYPMKKIHRLKRNYFTLPDHCLMQCNAIQVRSYDITI